MRFAAFHFKVEVLDAYDRWDYRMSKKFPLFSSTKFNMTADVGPSPSFLNLFRQECVKNTPRLWLDFSATKDEKNGAMLEDVLYGDWRLQNECVRWLHLPLSTLPSAHQKISDCESEAIKVEWRPPPLAGCERVLHIGSERSKLDMAQIADFVKRLANVCRIIIFMRPFF